MGATRIPRRSLLRTAGGVTAAAAVAGCGSGTSRGASGGKSSKSLVVSNSGGTYGDALRKAVYDPFSKETGISITTVNYQSAQILAQIKQGDPQFDVIDNSLLVYPKMARAGALHPLDHDRLKHAGPVPDHLRTEYAIGKNTWASLMAYRKDSLARTPRNWADFWNTSKFSGPRSLQSLDADVPELEFALLADGVALDELYPLDVDRAFKAMTRIRGDVKKFWDTGAMPALLIGRKEVALTSLWNGRADDLIKQGQPVAYQWAGARRHTNGWAIPKGSEKLDTTYRLIDYSLRPEVQAALAKIFPQGPVVPAALKRLSTGDLERLPTSAAHLKTGFDLDVDWWDKNQDAVAKRWQEWANV
ncbi:ABC transporter substrate-binding protein [Streptomyces fractus]|uniref:ABC transporter substrate-binding protein n=1 Tax=Streptomyces fractus TaxID=641806 RepID=UPI003CFAADD4